MTMFKKGDKVSVLDDTIDGVVTGVNGTEITIETTDGFALKYDAKQLIKNLESSILNLDNVSFNPTEIKKQKEEPKRRLMVKEKIKGETPPPEFDLHIEKLAKN